MLDVPEVSAKIAQTKEQLLQQLHKHKWRKNGATADQLRQLKAKQKV